MSYVSSSLIEALQKEKFAWLTILETFQPIMAGKVDRVAL